MADEKKDQEETGSKKPGFLENKVILLGGVVALQLVLAVGLTTLVIMPKLGNSQASASAQPSVIEEAQELGVLLSLGEIIVTLRNEQNPSTTRYLRLTVDLELADQVSSDAAAARLPILRDTVIMTLTDRTAEDLNRPEGMKGLRDELMRRLDGKLSEGMLRHIYFSDLVIQ